jgi:hypothetical protein
MRGALLSTETILPFRSAVSFGKRVTLVVGSGAK